MSEEKLVPLQGYLEDPVVVAVADAFVRVGQPGGEPPRWNTLAEKMAAQCQTFDASYAEQSGWRVVREAVRFIEMYRALMNALDPDFREIEDDE